jgi:hypothetical protein
MVKELHIILNDKDYEILNEEKYKRRQTWREILFQALKGEIPDKASTIAARE